MGQFLRRGIVMGFAAGVLLILGGHLFLRYYVSTEGFQNWANQQLQKYFQRNVEVSSIRVEPINKVVLEGIRVAVDSEDPSNTVEIQQIQFHFNPLNFFQHEWKLPRSLMLESPSLSVNRFDFLDSLSAGGLKDLPVSLFSQLQMRGGHILIQLPYTSQVLEFAEIHAVIRSNIKGRLEIHADAVARGILEGPVKLSGEIRVLDKSYRLQLDFDNLNVSRGLPVAVERMQGSMVFEDGRVRVGPVKAVSNGWDLTLAGQVDDIREMNKLKTSIMVGRDETLFGLQVAADLSEGSMRGTVHLPAARVIPFSGGIEQSPRSILFRDIQMETGYQGSGLVNFASGDYSFEFENGMHRIHLDSNLSGEELNMMLNLNHFKIFGMDLVTLTKIHFHPVETDQPAQPWRLVGQIFTDYFILEQQPLDDLQGNFFLDPQGIEELNVSWGNAFKLDGSVRFRSQKSEADLNLRVHQFELSEVEELAAKPLPKSLSGTLDGKLHIEGWLEKPDVFGQFTLKTGMIGKLEFDRAIIQFRGFPPYLALNDSRIMRGRTKLYLKGALDLSLENMLHGVWIETGDKLVIWKGLSLASSEEESGSWEIKTPLAHLPALEVVLQGEDDSQHLGSQDALQDESYVSVSPKIKF